MYYYDVLLNIFKKNMNLYLLSSQKRKLQKNMAHLTQLEMYVKSDGKRRRSRPPLLCPRPRPSPPPPPPPPADGAPERDRPRPAEMDKVCKVVQLHSTREHCVCCLITFKMRIKSRLQNSISMQHTSISEGHTVHTSTKWTFCMRCPHFLSS